MLYLVKYYFEKKYAITVRNICLQGEIDAREDSFRSAMESGNRLVESDHYAAEEVKDKVRIYLFVYLCQL